MPKFINGEVIDLTPEQIAAIDWFIANPPKSYATFYKLYKKILSPAIFLLIVAAIVVVIIVAATDANLFDLAKYLFFGAFGLGMVSLGFYLYKHFYTKHYAKTKLGWDMKMWNKCTMGISWNI
jgi:hypothetical protein